MQKIVTFLIGVVVVLSIKAQSPNLLDNASFEDWDEGYAVSWKSGNTVSAPAKDVTRITAPANVRTGASSVALQKVTGRNTRLGSKELTLTAGTYSFSVYVKSKNAKATVLLGYFDTEGNGTYVYDNKEQAVNNQEWTRVEHTFTLTQNTRLNLIVNNEENLVYLDDATLLLTENPLTALSLVKKELTDKRYNLSGRRVGSEQRGLLIVNGQKVWK